MEFIVDIDSVASKFVQFQVSLGEIVYCKSSKLTETLIKGLIGGESRVTGSVLGRKLSTITDTDKLRTHRSEIGYVDEDMYLSRDHTILQNFELYLTGSPNLDAFVSNLDTHLEYFGLKKETPVSILSPREVFYTKLSFCLAKKPKLIVIPKAFTFTSQSIFKSQMAHIYELIMDGDLTYIANVSDSTLTENFPGRMVTL